MNWIHNIALQSTSVIKILWLCSARVSELFTWVASKLFKIEVKVYFFFDKRVLTCIDKTVVLPITSTEAEPEKACVLPIKHIKTIK